MKYTKNPLLSLICFSTRHSGAGPSFRLPPIIPTQAGIQNQVCYAVRRPDLIFGYRCSRAWPAPTAETIIKAAKCNSPFVSLVLAVVRKAVPKK
jgi:hypothetical protein